MKEKKMEILLSKNLLCIESNSNKLTGKRKSEGLTVLEWKILLMAIKTFKNKNFSKLKKTLKKKEVPLKSKEYSEIISKMTEEDRTITIDKAVRKQFLANHRIEKIKDAVTRLQSSYLPIVDEKDKWNYANIITDSSGEKGGVSFKFDTKMIRNLYYQELNIGEKNRHYNNYSMISEDIFNLKKSNSYPLFIVLSSLDIEKDEILEMGTEELNELFKSNYDKTNLPKLLIAIEKDINSLERYSLEIERGLKRKNEVTGKVEYYQRFKLKTVKLSEDVEKVSEEAKNKNEFYKESHKDEAFFKLAKEFDEDVLVSAIIRAEKSLKNKATNFTGFMRKMCKMVEEDNNNYVINLKEIPNL